MFHNIDLSKKVIRPQFQLVKPDKTIVANVPEFFNATLKFSLNATSELNFRIPCQISKNHILQHNPHIDLCKNKYLVKLTLGALIIWFIIDKSSVVSDTSSGDYLHVQAFSLEYELSSRHLRSYKVDSITLSYVFNTIFTDTLWTLGSIPSDMVSVTRSFDVSNMSLLSFVYHIGTSFNLTPLFDTANRQINFYHINDIGINKGLLVTDQKYLVSLSDETDNTNFCTRLFPYGYKDNTINLANPTGFNYVEDYTYFLAPFSQDGSGNVLTHSDYMSDGLCKAQLAYQTLISSKVGQFNTYFQQLSGVAQVETNTVVSTVTTAGNATVVVTASGMTNSPKTINVAVSLGDTAILVAGKIVLALISDVDIGGFFTIASNGPNVILTVKTVKANDSTMRLTVNNGTCAGLTPSTSVHTTAGISGLQPTLTSQQNDLDNLNTQLKITNYNIQSALNNSQDPQHFQTSPGVYVNLYTQQTSQLASITSKQNDINTTQGQINTVLSNISSLRSTLSLTNNFTANQLAERKQFYIDKTWTDKAYITANDLYLAAQDQLNQWKIPPLTMKIDIVNFLESITEQNNWDKLVLGDTINIKHPKLGVNVSARIMEVDFNFENTDVNLTLSNINKIQTPEMRYQQLFYKANYAGNTIDVNKYNWDASQTNAQSYTDTTVQNVNNSLLNLAVTVNNTSANGYITLTESQSLNTAMNQLNSESTNLINNATTVGVATTTITNYQTALTNLQTELNKWIGQSNYPIYITSTQRININTLFQNVQDTKSKLVTAITNITYNGTIKYRSTGAPTNNPVPNAIIITNNSNGSCNIKLTWNAYTQGANQADFLMLYWNKTSATPTITDASLSFDVNTSGASYFIFEGVSPSDTYSFGITSARRTENGLEIGTIQTIASWTNVTSGTPNFTGNINGATAATVVTNASNGNSAYSTVNNILVDGYLTKDESKTLLTSYNQLSYEAGYNATPAPVGTIIDQATKLSITTELTNYQNALSTLKTDVNSWVGLPSYPVVINSTQRTNLQNEFQNVQNTKSILMSKMNEVRNTNVAGWGIESGANITYTNYRVVVPASTPFVSYTQTNPSPLTYTITVNSTANFPASGAAFFTMTNNQVGSFNYTSIDATHFYGATMDNISPDAWLSNITTIKSLTNIYLFPNYNTGVVADISISQATAVNKYNQRFVVPAKTWLAVSVAVTWTDVNGMDYRYFYIDSTGNFQMMTAGDTGGMIVLPPNAPDGGINVGYMVVGYASVPPDGTLNLGSKAYNADGTPFWQIITVQDFRYRNDKIIQYNSSNTGINTATYDSTPVSPTVSAGSYFTQYIPLGVGKRQCEASITSATSVTAADVYRQGAKFTVGRKPGGGSSAGIKLVSGLYVDVNGYSTHVDQKRHSDNPAYGDYIVPPSSLNANYTTIYDLDLIPYPSDLTQICLKIMFYNYYTSAETLNLRVTWMAY